MKLTMTVKHVVLIPVWILTLILQPHLPDAHPWRHQKLSLEWWARGATHMTYQFSLVMGMHALGGIVLLIYWLWK